MDDSGGATARFARGEWVFLGDVAKTLIPSTCSEAFAEALARVRTFGKVSSISTKIAARRLAGSAPLSPQYADMQTAFTDFQNASHAIGQELVTQIASGKFETRRLVSVSGVDTWADEPYDAWRSRSIRPHLPALETSEWLACANVHPLLKQGRQSSDPFELKSVQIRNMPQERADLEKAVSDGGRKKKAGRPKKEETKLAEGFAREWLEDEGEDLRAESGKQAKCEADVHRQLDEIGLSLSESVVRDVVTRVAREISDEKRAGKADK